MQRLRRFRALDPLHRRDLLEAIAFVALAEIGLRLVRLPRLRQLLHHVPGRPPVRGAEPIDRIGWAIAAAARQLHPRASCLVRAVAAEAMLRRRGFDPELHLGVLPGSRQRVEAHAWVGCEGRIVSGDVEELTGYQRLTPARQPTPRDPLTAVLRGDRVSWHGLARSASEVIEASEREDLAGLIYERLQLQAAHGWPAEVVHRLEETVRREIAIEALRRRELTAALDALARAGIPAILLKGTALAYTVYTWPASRQRSDTDLLIRRSDVAAVNAALSPLGYLPARSSGDELLFSQFELSKTDRFGVDHALDFHWKISTQPAFAEVLSFDEVGASRTSVTRLAPDAWTAGPIHSLLLACIHPVMHHRNEERLIWIYDVHLLASRLDSHTLERFADLAVERGVGAVCRHQLLLAHDRFGTAIPQEVLTRLSTASAEPTARYLSPNRRWRHEFAASLRGLPRWADRARLAREVLLPKPAYMFATYGMASGRGSAALLPALYTHRALSGAWKVVRGRK